MRLLRFLPRFRKAYAALAELERREGWSRAAIEAFQLERLNDVWRQATERVPHYRRLAREAGLPPRFGSLEEFRSAVPVLPKANIRSRPHDFLAEGAPSGHWHRTSGSTGANTAVYWPEEGHRQALHGKYRFLAQWGVDIFDRTAFLWGRAATFKTGWAGLVARWRLPIEDRLRNRIRLSAYHLDRAHLHGHFRRLARFQPALLYAYSSAAYLLACEAEASGFRCPSLKLAVLTSEFIFPHTVPVIERALGVPAVSEYGSVECGFLAGEDRDRKLRVREDAVLLETLPREDGRYDIIVTVLNNHAFPLLRYTLGDVTDAPLEVPPHGFAVLRNVAGRECDLVLSKGGCPLHPTRFNHIFEHDKRVRRWRIHQHADGAVSVSVEPTDPADRLSLARLEQEIRELVEGYPVTVAVAPSLDVSGAGKHRWIQSDLARPGVEATATTT